MSLFGEKASSSALRASIRFAASLMFLSVWSGDTSNLETEAELGRIMLEGYEHWVAEEGIAAIFKADLFLFRNIARFSNQAKLNGLSR